MLIDDSRSIPKSKFITTPLAAPVIPQETGSSTGFDTELMRCDPTPRPARLTELLRAVTVGSSHADGGRGSRVIANFHYTGPTGPDGTGPDQTKSAHFVGDRLNSTTRARPDPHGPARTFFGPGLRETPLGQCGSPTKSVRVRAGPVGSSRVRVVEFSL